ncbi:hypothetical protein BDZ97DRAFT_1781067 [Flammula alnicola]|nr:hypothetical protein BDZ97DRAFT_1781067 [Flammula alnicola]
MSSCLDVRDGTSAFCIKAFILGCVVQATPLSVVTRSNTAILSKTAFSTTPEGALNAALAGHGLHNLVDTTATNTAATSPVPATSLEKRAVNPLLLFCSGENCSGVCDAFTIIGNALDTCFAPAPDPFFSLFISNPSDLELLFQVGAADNTICSGLALIPETNACFNINPFGESFALLNTGVTF